MSRSVLQSSAKETARNLEELRTSETGKLIITSIDRKIIAFLSVSGKMKCITVLGKDSDGTENADLSPEDIVIAIVKDVKNDIGACFIEYASGCDGYLPLNKLPKGVTVKQGDLIPVKITSQAQKGKRASFTAKIDYSKIENGSELSEKASHLTKYSYLYKSNTSYTDKINKVFKQGEFDEIVTDIELVYEMFSKDFPNVRLYDDKSFGLDKLYSLKTALDEALDRNVWLKCGGFLIFDKTEAMTVIDVNSGKFTPTKGTDKESAYMAVNTEAAIEICRQLRLRNISGIVIIDFINLKSDEDKEQLLNLLKEETLADTETVMVIDITELGLVEVTRKKEFPPLYEQLR
jgi:Ribonuclease G/E